MAEPAEKRRTVEEFLAWDDGTDRRYELVGGEVVEIPLQPEAHGAIMATIGALLRQPRTTLSGPDPRRGRAV